MAAVGAASYAGTLAAHALPSHLASIKKYVPRLVKAIPQLYANFNAGLENAKLVTSRYEKFGPSGPLKRTTWSRPTLSNEDIWVDRELPALLPRADFLKYLQWRKDLYAAGQLFAPTALLGPVGLVQVVRQARCIHELPSPLYQSADDVIEGRLMRDMERLRWAPSIRAFLYLSLARNVYCDTNHEDVHYTEAEYEAVEELFDMDAFTLSNWGLFEQFVPIMHRRAGEIWRISPADSHALGRFYGFPTGTLGGKGRLANLVAHVRLLRQDDEYLRQAGGAASLSDGELFDAAFERGIARQEEGLATRGDLEQRLALWLKLGDKAAWAKALPDGDEPTVFFQLLLAANVYCDPPFDPKLDQAVVAKIAATEGVTAEGLRTNIRGSYDAYIAAETGTLAKEARAAHETKELVKAEKVAAAQAKLDGLVTSVQAIAHPAQAVAETVEVVAEATEEETKTAIPPIASTLVRKWVDRPVVKRLSEAELKDMKIELQYRNRALLADPTASPSGYDEKKYAEEHGLMSEAAKEDERDAKMAADLKKFADGAQ